MGNLFEDKYKFLVISFSVLFRIINILDKSCRETKKTHFMINNCF